MHEHLESGAYVRSDNNVWFWDATKQGWEYVGSEYNWSRHKFAGSFTLIKPGKE